MLRTWTLPMASISLASSRKFPPRLSLSVTLSFALLTAAGHKSIRRRLWSTRSDYSSWISCFKRQDWILCHLFVSPHNSFLPNQLNSTIFLDNTARLLNTLRPRWKPPSQYRYDLLASIIQKTCGWTTRICRDQNPSFWVFWRQVWRLLLPWNRQDEWRRVRQCWSLQVYNLPSLITIWWLTWVYIYIKSCWRRGSDCRAVSQASWQPCHWHLLQVIKRKKNTFDYLSLLYIYLVVTKRLPCSR